MTDLISSLEPPESSLEEMCSVAVPSSVGSSCETLMWEGWNIQSSHTHDSSTNKLELLQELATSSNSALIHQQSNAPFCILPVSHPFPHHSSASVELARNSDRREKSSNLQRGSSSEIGTRISSFEGLNSSQHTTKEIHLGGIPYRLPEDHGECAVSPHDDECHLLSNTSSGSFLLWHSMGPKSPSSPLAFHNIGVQHSIFDECEPLGQSHTSWSAASVTSPLAQYFHAHSMKNEGAEVFKQSDLQISKTLATYQPNNEHNIVTSSDRIASTTSHSADPCGPEPRRLPTASYDTEMILNPSESVLTTPNMLSTLEIKLFGASTVSEQCMNFVGELPKQRLPSISNLSHIADSNADRQSMEYDSGSFGTDSLRTGLRKNRIFLSDEEAEFLPQKRSKCNLRSDFQMDHLDAVSGNAGLRGSSSSENSAFQTLAIGTFEPALNTDGKPRARRGSATDPQSLYARSRREKISERLRKLQHLIPNGAKVDIVTMLDEAVHYVQFLQQQVTLLKSDEQWMYAAPTLYRSKFDDCSLVPGASS